MAKKIMLCLAQYTATVTPFADAAVRSSHVQVTGHRRRTKDGLWTAEERHTNTEDGDGSMANGREPPFEEVILKHQDLLVV